MPSGGRTPAAWCSGCFLKEDSCKICDSDLLSVSLNAGLACLHTDCVFVSAGMHCMWSTMASRCHGWCSVTSGRVQTWWTVSSHGPRRKPSSLFSWPLPLLSAWSLTWLNLHILLPRPSLGRGINQSVRWLINWLIYWFFHLVSFFKQCRND